MANLRIRGRSGFIQRGGRSVRETRWLDIPPTFTALGAAGTAAILASLTAAELALRPFTVVRTRGILAVESDQSAATEIYHASYGLAVVSEQAFAIGVTAVPTPGTDRASDLWFVYEDVMGLFTFKSGVGFEEPSSAIKYFDSKAMRKVEDGQDLVVVTEANTNSNGLQIRNAGRILIKLH